LQQTFPSSFLSRCGFSKIAEGELQALTPVPDRDYKRKVFLNPYCSLSDFTFTIVSIEIISVETMQSDFCRLSYSSPVVQRGSMGTMLRKCTAEE
jgi:hypothetical protein